MTKPAKNRGRAALRVKRVYAAPAAGDGTRVLVDRLWPRGVSREAGRIDFWLKGLAPSDDLRHRFHANRNLWNEFRKAYRAELARSPAKEAIAELRALAAKGTITLLFASQDEERNNAVVLAGHLSAKSRRAAPAARRRKSSAATARGRTSA